MIIAKKKKKQKEEAPEVAPQRAPISPGSLLRENGILMLVDKFDQEKIMPIVAQIMEYNMMDEEDRPKMLKLIINSPGGSVFSAFHLIDAIKTSEIPVATIGHGLVASCGILTLMSGQKGHRYISHNASVMSHQYSWGSAGKEHELYAKVKEFEMASARMIEHYKKCTKKSETYIRKHLLHATDEWLTPEECLKHGVVDHIWETY